MIEGLVAVTGAGSGIGAGVARRLAAQGARVAVLDRDAAPAEAVAAEVGGVAHALDVSDPEQVRAVFGALGPVRGLVNCAGISALAPLVTQDIEEFRKVVAVHLEGTFLCLQAAARSMVVEGAGGTIVNISSINALFAHRGLGAYSAAKAGISMLTKVAALELAQSDIRVNAIAPGIVATGMTAEVVADPVASGVWAGGNPFGRIGHPFDIADVAVFLSSDESRWVTGQTIAVDGGGSLRAEPKIFPDEAWSRAALLAQIEGTA